MVISHFGHACEMCVKQCWRLLQRRGMEKVKRIRTDVKQKCKVSTICHNKKKIPLKKNKMRSVMNKSSHSFFCFFFIYFFCFVFVLIFSNKKKDTQIYFDGERVYSVMTDLTVQCSVQVLLMYHLIRFFFSPVWMQD